MLLLVNHERNELNGWQKSLKEWGVPCQSTREGFTALQMAEVKKITAVISRVDLPLVNGYELARMLKKEDPGLIVALAAPPGKAVPSLPTGKRHWDIGPLPLEGPEFQKLVGSLLLAEGTLLQDKLESPLVSGPEGFEEIVGLSLRMKEIFSLVRKVRDQDLTVLIQGESGTGKELVARALHRHSRRADQPFVSVNCAALPENLLESELFGHEKGAFTGADSRVIGRFEQADRGCIFMDEIGDMSPATQAKVLRVFEGHDFERVGGREKITVDVRIIAATNRDLEEQVERGTFREDLFYRLSAFPLTLPALRERMEDVPLITAHILREHNRTVEKKITAVAPAATAKLLDYEWPGNVRHLENVVKRAAILAAGGVIEPDHIQPERRRAPRPEPERPAAPPPPIRSLAEVEREAIEAALAVTEMNISRAAEALGITRPTLYKKIKVYGIKIET
ncbi:MAG: sigma-54 dependent transcriptional regulator [Candidatus Erginobacter occultus]|nr:sigma-54 dependent transcriptional regulator [Candidatus Erginobacter occultus]